MILTYNLADEEKIEIKSIASPLYEYLGECFAERINPETYHVTLHDLCSDNNLSSIADRMADNERSIKDLQKGYRYTQNIVVESTFVFNMVGSSIVLGFIPKEETGYRGLIYLKQIFQTIYPIDYPLTPHVTLAYFSQNGIDSSKRAALYKLLVSLSTKSVTLSLNSDRLLYQKFRNMNHYYNTFKIGIHNAFV